MGRNARDLGHLPRLNGLVLGGGVRPLSVYRHEGDQVFQPAVVLWLDFQTGAIRHSRIFRPDERTEREELLAGLREALAHPSLGSPGLPDRVLVEEGAAVEDVRALLDPLGVAVEVLPKLPPLDDLAASLDEYLGGNRNAPAREPFSWNATPDLLPPLFKAIAGFARRAPWGYMDDNPPIAVSLGTAGPRGNVRTLYACVLGAAGLMRGLALYYSLGGYERTVAEGTDRAMLDDLKAEEIDALINELRRQGAPVDEVPAETVREALQEVVSVASGPPQTEDSLLVDFEPARECDPTYLQWLRARNLPVASQMDIPYVMRIRRKGEPRLPNDREIQALTLAIEAINGFLSRFRRQLSFPTPLSDALRARIKVSSGETIEVWWPGDW